MMDPNANLNEQLEAAKRITAMLNGVDHGAIDADTINLKELADLAARLADRVESLDLWLTGAGFLPERWELARDPRLKGVRP